MQNPVRGLLHGSAAIASVAGGVALFLAGPTDLASRFAMFVYAFSLVLLYTVSSSYHAIPWSPTWKKRLQRLDHCSIYVLIAGTYTPIGILVLDGWLAVSTLGVAWGVTAVGIFQKVLLPHWGNTFSITMQTGLGWLGVLLAVPVAERLPAPALWLGLAGGIVYTVGMVALVTRRPALWPRTFSYHEVFHTCVVVGSGAHFAMTYLYVV